MNNRTNRVWTSFWPLVALLNQVGLLVVWIVGLAVPVTASYIICAVITAPALIKLGVPDFAAHMFIFYYAVLSEVSPPTALSPFAAAAITGGDLRAYFQPVVDLTSRELLGVEALVRWDHPQRGIVMPGAFISIADIHTFTENMTNGAGYLALAAVIFGGWNIGRTVAAWQPSATPCVTRVIAPDTGTPSR